MSREVWRWVVGYEGIYKVSNTGRVRSVDRRRYRETVGILRGRMLKQGLTADGYSAVSLTKRARCKRRTVHQLVLEAFVGPRPVGMEACHNDGNKLNNFVDNLRWDTHRANSDDTIRHGTMKGERKKRKKVIVA